MDDSRWQRIEEIFHQVSRLPKEERPACLDRMCDADADLRKEVVSLLESMETAGSFMDTPIVSEGLALLDGRCQERFAGRTIGSYRIVRQIGRGGMGAVYLAERADDQYRKRVAIKLMRLEAADPFLLSRFHTERQILANLE
ncbi:MAG: serine/threonine protein kinase, partial [Acidobacteria bacterium]|nr:serine/threonine protein kinase [Acidobacteriota bacterium]